jgi:prevent-host-death family protein
MAGKAVGIRDLKAHISKHLRNVKKGREIVVSERGKAFARIVPIVQPQPDRSKLHDLLFKLSQEGKILLPAIYARPLPPRSRKKVKGSPFSDAVREGRR